MDSQFISNIMDITSMRSCTGGLFKYTTESGFRRNNLICAYNYNNVGRYGYNASDDGEIQPTGGKYLENDQLNDSATYGYERGEGYFVPFRTQSGYKFMTTEEFSRLGELLRERNVKKARGEDYYKNLYGENDKFSAKNISETTNRGTEFSVKETALSNSGKTISESYEDGTYATSARQYTEIINDKTGKKTESQKYESLTSTTNTLIEDASPNPFYNKFNIDANEFLVPNKSKSLSEIGKTARDFLSKYKVDRSKYLNQGEINNTIAGGVPVDYSFGDTLSISGLISLPYIFDDFEGLYTYNAKNREEYLSRKYVFYTYKSPYGVSKEIEDQYTTATPYKRTENIEIDNAFTKGSFVGTNVNNDVIYNFYDGESDENGVGAFNPDSVSDRTSVQTGFTDGASKLITYTNKLFNEQKINSLINRFHTKDGISRGRNLRVKGGQGTSETGYDNPYCRVWTAHHQYARLRDRIRPFYNDGKATSIADTQAPLPDKMRPNGGKERLNDYSVLQEDGFVKISPNRGDFSAENATNSKTNIKKYMFSIENLAWKDINLKNELTQEQIGPNQGRIMWFPPYNLKFSENVSVNWNSNAFIGRGEQIYTYTNTDRSGTLSFTILIDHPSILNTWRGTSEQVDDIKEAQDDLLRYFAGCGNLEQQLTEGGTKEVNNSEEESKDDTTPKPKTESKDIAYAIFFPNDFSAKNTTGPEDAMVELSKYETSTGTTYSERDADLKGELLKPWNIDNTMSVYQLNNSNKQDKLIKELLLGSNDEKVELRHLDKIEGLGDEIKGDTYFGVAAANCKISIDIQGFATNHGKPINNQKLCTRRADTIESLIKHYAPTTIGNDKIIFNRLDNKIIPVEDIDNRQDINVLNAKIGRAAVAIFHIEWEIEDTPVNESTYTNIQVDKPETVQKENAYDGVKSNTLIEPNTDYTYDNEYLYFSSVRDGNDKMVYKNIVDKVKYFDPAYHSITPEGFNARLTFLHQCTRQGPTVTANALGKTNNNYVDYAGNLSFGRSPYCILRIGDFFNTKICIDSLSIDYDTGSGIQWDLNPEGVGVQPMFANVNINFKFLGGQDITGPVERLQNAVTANYYANTSIYSRHSDTDTTYYDAIGQTEKLGDDVYGPTRDTIHTIEKKR